MATKMEMAIITLVLVAIILSGSAFWYGVSILGEIGGLTDNLADLTSSMIDLTDGMSDIAERVNASLEELEQLQNITDRLKDVEGKLTPTITVVGPWSGKEMDAFLPVLARFEVLTGINVRYKVLRAEDLAQLLPTQFAAGKAPGDVIFMWNWFITEQAEDGHVLNMTGLVDESDFLPGALDSLKVDETLYGSAYTGKVKPGFWYKKSFFEAHNLTVPTTWAEFETLLATIDAIPGIDNPIVSGDTVGWPLSDITEHFLVAYNGSDLSLKLINGTESWTTGPAREMFENRLVPLLEADYFSDPIDWSPDALDLWWQEDYALYFMGSWITGMVDDPDDLGVFSLPGADGLVFSADYFFIPAYTEYPDEAKELFQFLASSEAQRVQVAQGGHIATIVDIDLSEYPEVDRRVANLTTGMNVLPDLDDTIGGEFQQTFWDQLKLLWVSPASLDDVLQEIQNVAP